MKLFYLLLTFAILTLGSALRNRNKFMENNALHLFVEQNNNNYKELVTGFFEVINAEKAMYKNCTPHEWQKNNSTDLQQSIPKLKKSVEFIKENIEKSLEHKNLKTICATPEGIIKIQSYLKKNLLGGPDPKSSTNKTSFIEVDRITKKKLKEDGMAPFDDIIKHATNLHSNLKTILQSPLFDRLRFTINCIRYDFKLKKKNEPVQMTITNFHSNLYKIIDKGVPKFIERIVGLFCDKDKYLSKAINNYNSFNSEEGQKKYNELGRFFAHIVLAVSK